MEGVRFALWAPNAQRVSVLGAFNGWDGRRHAMRLRRECGVWEIFIPGLAAGARYKYDENRYGNERNCYQKANNKGLSGDKRANFLDKCFAGELGKKDKD